MCNCISQLSLLCVLQLRALIALALTLWPLPSCLYCFNLYILASTFVPLHCALHFSVHFSAVIALSSTTWPPRLCPHCFAIYILASTLCSLSFGLYLLVTTSVPSTLASNSWTLILVSLCFMFVQLCVPYVLASALWPRPMWPRSV